MNFFRPLLIILLSLALTSLRAQNEVKTAYAARTDNPPRIDGSLHEDCWKKAIPVNVFRMFLPVYDIPSRFPTEVRILYDDRAIYVGARMLDPFPDSILRQAGNRDDAYMNADDFGVSIDTYNNQLDAYYFTVTASGVQSDSRRSDETYNAVWESKVSTDAKGWTAEMRIPYSALRFPAAKVQTWGFEITRMIRRYRETDQWALLVKGAENDLVYFGKLTGMEDIRAPLRLSATPYLSLAAENYPYNIRGKKNTSYSYSGGLDLKYGLNESFTLDMTLLPDFSQVQSDNQIKNLTAFETVYEEQRPFFQESLDLFSKCDLFYTRRIGRLPLLYEEAAKTLKQGELLKKNPLQAVLLNALKFSGRNRKGLAIGFFNALTGNTYATIGDSLGHTRKFLTDPLSNYNIMVLDQAIRHNSEIYLINTNVTRGKDFNSANVTGAGLSLNNKSNKYNFSASGAFSQRIFRTDTGTAGGQTSIGFKYAASLSKVSGNFQWSLYDQLLDNNYDANDIGLTMKNNERMDGMSVEYNIYEPFWHLRYMNNSLAIVHTTNFLTGKTISDEIKFSSDETFMNYLTTWAGFSLSPTEGYDYYEPRAPGRYYRSPAYWYVTGGFSPDYRKPFALDMNFQYAMAGKLRSRTVNLMVRPIIRFSDRWTATPQLDYMKALNDYGYADTDSSRIIFGRRDITNTAVTLSTRFLFRNDLSLSLRVRHYWSAGKYRQFFELMPDGHIGEISDFKKNKNFSFNAFNMDLVFSWEFAPGSRLEMVWKNSILKEDEVIEAGFGENLSRTLSQPQLNNFSLKALYYLDYQQFRRSEKKQAHSNS